MESYVLFTIAIISILAIGLSLSFSNLKNLVTFFKTRTGLGVLKGIVLFIAFGVILGGLSQCAFSDEPKLRFFEYGKVFLGLDQTKKLSPMCKPGGPNDKLTSNGGIVINLIQSIDRRFELNYKYTHHSCAFSEDDKSYDAVWGLETSYRLW